MNWCVLIFRVYVSDAGSEDGATPTKAPGSGQWDYVNTPGAIFIQLLREKLKLRENLGTELLQQH